jgi:hypothetical protein
MVLLRRSKSLHHLVMVWSRNRPKNMLYRHPLPRVPCSKDHLIDLKTTISLSYVCSWSTTLQYINTLSLSSPIFYQLHREYPMIPKPSITSTMASSTMVRKRRSCLHFVRRVMDMNTTSTALSATLSYYPDLYIEFENKSIPTRWLASRKEAKAQSPCLFRWLPAEDPTERRYTTV